MTTRTPEELEEKLHYHFKNKELLITALTHSSYANESKTPTLYNERLEFLGDSVLGFVTAEYLFAKHPTAPEGELTRIRALLVCEDSLHEVAQRLELGKYLKLGNGEESCGGRPRPSVPGHAAGAAELDYGLHLYLGFAAVIAVNPEIDISDLERVRGYDVMKIMRIGRDFISGKSEEPYTPDSSDAQSETTPEPSTHQRETSESEG